MLECGHRDVISWLLPRFGLRNLPAELRLSHDKAREEGEYFPKTRNPVPWNLIDYQGRTNATTPHEKKTDSRCFRIGHHWSAGHDYCHCDDHQPASMGE
jgi:hypothetical protein